MSKGSSVLMWLEAQFGGTWKHSGSPALKFSRKGPKKAVIRVFMGISLHSQDWLNYWPMVTDSASSSSPLSRQRRMQLKIPKLQSQQPVSIFQFSSVAQSCVTLCDPMNRSTPGLPVHHQLPEFTHTHIHQVSDAVQPSHPLSSPSPPAPNPSQHQSLFQWVNSLYKVAKVLEFQL